MTETLAIRALNHWRGIDDVSYVGLRAYTDVLRAHWKGWARTSHWNLVQRAERPRYRDTLRFKEIDTRGEVVTRSFLAASPSTAVAEARVLSGLAAAAAYSVPQQVYSYRWPVAGMAGSSYSFYLDHYLERSRHISDLLSDSESDARCVLVADIKNFYPSIEPERVLRELAKVLSSSGLSLEERRLVEATVAGYLQASSERGHGLAVGPALSHVLANMAMAEVDRALFERHGDKYTRYVDDFAIVVDSVEADTEREFLRALVESHGLHLNERKADVVPGSVWRTQAPVAEEDPLAALRQLTVRLGVYLSREKASGAELAARLRGLDTRLPLSGLVTQTRYRRFQIGFLRRALREPGLGLQLLTDDVGDLVQATIDARELTRRVVRSLGWPSEWTDEGITARRWRLSRLRRALWWSIQLWPDEGLGEIEARASRERGLRELGLVARAVRSGDVGALLTMPGVPLAMALSILSNSGRVPSVEWGALSPSTATGEGALLLLCRSQASAPEGWVSELPSMEQRILLSRLSGRAGPERQRPDRDYTDEMDSLLMLQSRETVNELVRSRGSLDEVPSLDIAYLLDPS